MPELHRKCAIKMTKVVDRSWVPDLFGVADLIGMQNWKPNKCPVEENAVVLVLLEINELIGWGRAKYFCWEKTGDPYSVLRWKLDAK